MKKNRWLIGMAATLLIGLLANRADQPRRVTGGLISGSRSADGQIQVFRGIPFAAPPVGALRWQAPQPVRPWQGVRACTAFSASPMQAVPAPFGPWSAEYLIPKTPISEDCLYLNVWTGATKPAEKRPVLVWIYGGGFGSGGSACPIYDGEAMARRGIVFVSPNYRVGPFGFFAHPELTEESGRQASGNYGLLDQQAALRWVRDNIAQFGGDPNNVTIAGQSAGSMSVNCLVASPLSAGLFTKAIAESGASFGRRALSLAAAEADGLTAMQKLGATSLTDLRSRPAAEILQKLNPARGPIIDGYVLPQAVPDLFRAGRQTRVTLLTGWNENEGLAGGPFKNAADFTAQINQQYGAKAATLLRYYPAGTDADAETAQRNLSRDQTFGQQNYTWATVASGQGQPVYVYRFARNVPATGAYAAYGAFHTAEVPYAYDNLRFIDRSLRPLTPADERLARQMADYWANFIRTGNPNGRGLPEWPRFDNQSRRLLRLDTTLTAQPMPDAAALDFLSQSLN